MIRKISIKLLRIIVRIAFLPFLLLFGFITLPFTIFFRWDGWFILGVVFEELCSLSEAKRLYLQRGNTEYNISNNSSPNLFSNDQIDLFNNSTGMSSYSNDLYNSPSYAYYPSNIHYSPPSD
jgi:hypothetical protein